MLSLTLTDYITGVANGSLDPVAILNHYLEKATQQDSYNAFVRLHPDYVAEHAEEFFKKPLAGAAIAVKDIFMTKGYETTCCSKILQGYIPTHSATSFLKLEEAGALMLGKANMDEFAMGGSNETSCFGPVKNPRDSSRVSGGSSGGSAAAVAADLCLAALGTDTGGSIRQPAALCGIVGTKMTYGRTSRYGVQAMESSLDHIGVLTKTVADAVELISHMSAQDPYDATTIVTTEEQKQARRGALQWHNLQGKKIAVAQQFFDVGLDEAIKQQCLVTLEQLKALGAQVDWVDIPILSYSVPTYYVLCPAGVMTNMARFDGIRFGLQEDTAAYERIADYYTQIRTQGFGDEVKRRILTGAYVLSAGSYDAYYRKALGVREQIKQECKKIFQNYDAIVGPTSPELAWKIGEKADDPIKNYLADIYTIAANLTGSPAISVPIGTVEREGKQLPVGFQIMTAREDEATMFGIAQQIAKVLV